ncbi:hypothetical protein ACINK0_11065 [Deinococcus sp. VB343]|uniref:hypothetical protein n=1 Tax=Deinococcus sp. VB343 TaxID=3385567 RepID=UPI0039C9A72E
MKRTLLLTCFSLFAFASAGNISGTKVSYKSQKDALTGGNASMLFVDATEDTSGKTYMALVCDLGDATYRLYSKASLGSYEGERVTVFYRTDDKALKSVEGKLREDTQTGKLTVLEFGYYSPQLFQTFASAQSKVVARVQRNTLSPLTLTFPVKGFMQGFRAIGSCE